MFGGYWEHSQWHIHTRLQRSAALEHTRRRAEVAGFSQKDITVRSIFPGSLALVALWLVAWLMDVFDVRALTIPLFLAISIGNLMRHVAVDGPVATHGAADHTRTGHRRKLSAA